MKSSAASSCHIRPASRRRLNGWKEIAVHLGRSVRTAQRWEKLFAMPVHRIATARAAGIFAHGDELDAWRVASEQARHLAGGPMPVDGIEGRGENRLRRLVRGLGLVTGLLATSIWARR